MPFLGNPFGWKMDGGQWGGQKNLAPKQGGRSYAKAQRAFAKKFGLGRKF